MDIDALEKMLTSGQNSAMLRLTLGNAYLRRGDRETALHHFREAVRLDPNYSAAWKGLGRLLAETGCHEEALETYRRGLAVAEHRGDMQVVRELKVFIRRLER